MRYEQGVITYELSLLVRPPGNSYCSEFTGIHGLNWKHTANDPCFLEVWARIYSFIEGQTVVAHNGTKTRDRFILKALVSGIC